MRQKNDLIPLAHFVGCNNVPMKLQENYLYILEWHLSKCWDNEHGNRNCQSRISKSACIEIMGL